MSIENEILKRVSRLETRVVRGFEELGVDTGGDNWMVVDDVNRTASIATLGRSVMVILTQLRRAGATQVGKSYELLYKGRVVGSVVLQDVIL
jgi:hypothetical protein